MHTNNEKKLKANLNQQAVKTLEKLLEKAKAGKLESLLILSNYDDNSETTMLCTRISHAYAMRCISDTLTRDAVDMFNKQFKKSQVKEFTPFIA